MARSLAELTDAELEAQFLEAEHHALLWADLDATSERSARWMQIAGELRAELTRRGGLPEPARKPTPATKPVPAKKPRPSKRPKPTKKPKPR